LSPAQTATEEKTSEKESIVPARRATLPLANDAIPFKIPSAKNNNGGKLRCFFFFSKQHVFLIHL
jgi:hypothetical protein